MSATVIINEEVVLFRCCLAGTRGYDVLPDGAGEEVIGDFDVNGAFSYYSIPYDDVETSMGLFASVARASS